VKLKNKNYNLYMDNKNNENYCEEKNNLKGNDLLKNFSLSIKENPNELDYFHILESISNQKVDKEIIHSVFYESI
jgi:hypothetical protein